MVSRRAYSRVKVNSVDVEQLTAKARAGAMVSLGLDIGKHEIVACLRWSQDQFERPWSVNNPFEIGALVELCVELNKQTEVVVAMESTGTYGDAVRRALTVAKIFDGVPSQHDGKDAAMIAELAAMGKGASWNYVPDPEALAHVRYHVRSIDHARNEFVRLIGRLEASVTRHWPELTRELELTSPTTLKLLSTYGSPAEASKNNQFKTELRKWGRKLNPSKIERIVESTQASSGIPMDSYELLWMKDLASQAIEANRKVVRCSKGIEEVLSKDTLWCNYVAAVGAGTLGVLLTTVGDPRNYPNGGSLLKALGLNLKERSSGTRKGELAVTKRGSAQARRWLYFWALRAVQKPGLKEWYFRFHASELGKPRKDYRKMKGLICLMRKLVRSLRRSVCDGEPFDYQKVIDQPKARSRKKKTED
jgi:transposase